MGGFDGLNLTAADLCGTSLGALKLIVTEEDSGQAYYVRHYEHFDWPEGASGPTVAIGVDCGYMTAAEVRTNFAGIVDDATIAAIVAACGLKGEAAGRWVAAHRNDVTITWSQAILEFVRRELPQWVKQVTDDIPGADKLRPDCLGTIASIAYNRGASFTLPGPRYAEMRAIRADVMSGNLADIPDQILSMRRLWTPGSDLWKRRGHEAALFDQGLANAPAPAPPAAKPAPADPHGTAWVQTQLNRLGARPQLVVDGELGLATQQAIMAFQAQHSIAIDGVAGPQTIDTILGLA
jgi:hypothetical protein